MTINEFTRNVIGGRSKAEIDRLQAEARTLIACGYKAEELAVLSNVYGKPAAQVVPKAWMRE